MSSSRRFHIVLDVENVMNNNVHDKDWLRAFIADIAERIEMTIIFGPVAVEGQPENPGSTAFAVVDFSHIAVHTFTNTDEVCIDVFSCKPFDYQSLYHMVKRLLGVQDKDIRRAVVTYNNRPKL